MWLHCYYCDHAVLVLPPGRTPRQPVSPADGGQTAAGYGTNIKECRNGNCSGTLGSGHFDQSQLSVSLCAFISSFCEMFCNQSSVTRYSEMANLDTQIIRRSIRLRHIQSSNCLQIPSISPKLGQRSGLAHTTVYCILQMLLLKVQLLPTQVSASRPLGIGIRFGCDHLEA